MCIWACGRVSARLRVSQIFLARRACYLMMTNERETQNLLVKVQRELGVQQVLGFGRQSRSSSESAAAAAVVEWCTLRPALPSAPRTAPACPDTFHRGKGGGRGIKINKLRARLPQSSCARGRWCTDWNQMRCLTGGVVNCEQPGCT